MSVFRHLPTLMERYGLLLLLLIAIAIFSLNSTTGSTFFTVDNARNILGNESVLALVALATIIPLVAGQIDLSVGPNAGLCSIVIAGLMSKSHLPVVPACLIGVLVGVAIGVLNGVLVAKAQINSIITTLGTTSIIGAIVLWYSSGLTFQNDISTGLINLGQGDFLGIPKPFVYLLVVAIICWYWLQHTPSGRNLEAAGLNPRAAALVGLNVPRMVFSSFVIAGAIAAFTGMLLVAVQAAGSPQIGPTFQLPAIAAAFLGATAIRPGHYNTWGCILAVFFVAVIVNGLTMWGAAGWVSGLVNGVALIVAVGMSVFYSKRRGMATPWKKQDTGSSDPDAPGATSSIGTGATEELTGAR